MKAWNHIDKKGFLEIDFLLCCRVHDASLAQYPAVASVPGIG
jgi:hypothetical protein